MGPVTEGISFPRSYFTSSNCECCSVPIDVFGLLQTGKVDHFFARMRAVFNYREIDHEDCPGTYTFKHTNTLEILLMRQNVTRVHRSGTDRFIPRDALGATAALVSQELPALTRCCLTLIFDAATGAG